MVSFCWWALTQMKAYLALYFYPFLHLSTSLSLLFFSFLSSFSFFVQSGCYCREEEGRKKNSKSGIINNDFINTVSFATWSESWFLENWIQRLDTILSSTLYGLTLNGVQNPSFLLYSCVDSHEIFTSQIELRKACDIL